MEELRLFQGKRRRSATAVLVRQASDVDADGGRRRRRRSMKPPCGMLRRRRRRHLRCWLSSSFILASISFLRFPSDYPNLVLDVVSDYAHIYCNLIQLLGFRKFSSFPFTFFPCLQRIENKGSIGFSPVLLMNSDQLYLPTFS